MKFISRLFPLLLLVSLFVVSCSQEEKTEEIVNPTPVDLIVDATPADLADFMVDVDITTLFSSDVSNRMDCPAFTHALNQFHAVNENCEFTKDYCEYLKLFWRIHIFIAAIQCDFEGGCANCENLVAVFDEAIRELREAGLHEAYVNNLALQNTILANLCLDCHE